jgi:coenzyme Q-binding protein COQ10
MTGTADQVGSSFTAPYRIAGRELEVHWTVTRVDKPRSIELTGTTDRGGHALSTTRMEPVGGGTQVEVELDYELPGGFAGEVADRLFIEQAMDRQIRHSNENFKALVEADRGASD